MSGVTTVSSGSHMSRSSSEPLCSSPESCTCGGEPVGDSDSGDDSVGDGGDDCDNNGGERIGDGTRTRGVDGTAGL